jgi:hypothetical protein
LPDSLVSVDSVDLITAGTRCFDYFISMVGPAYFEYHLHSGFADM